MKRLKLSNINYLTTLINLTKNFVKIVQEKETAMSAILR